MASIPPGVREEVVARSTKFALDAQPVQFCVWNSSCKPHVPALLVVSKCGRFMFSVADNSRHVFVWEVPDVWNPGASSVVPQMILSTEAHPSVVGLLYYRAQKHSGAAGTTAATTTNGGSNGSNASAETPQIPDNARGRFSFEHKLVCVGSNGVLSQWCARSGRCLRVSTNLFLEASLDTLQVKPAPDTARAILLVHQTLVIVIDVRSLQVITEVQLRGDIQAVAISKSLTISCVTGNHIFTAALREVKTAAFDTASAPSSPSVLPETPRSDTSVSFAPNVVTSDNRSGPSGLLPIADFTVPQHCRPTDPDETALELRWSPHFEALLVVWPTRWTIASKRWLKPTGPATHGKKKKKHTLYSEGRAPACAICARQKSQRPISASLAGYAVPKQPQTSAEIADSFSPRWTCAQFMHGPLAVLATDECGRTFVYSVPKGRRRASIQPNPNASPASPLSTSQRTLAGGPLELVYETPVCSGGDWSAARATVECSDTYVTKFCPVNNRILIWKCDTLLEQLLGRQQPAERTNGVSRCHASMWIGPNWTASFARQCGLALTSNMVALEVWGGVALAESILDDTHIRIRSCLRHSCSDTVLGLSHNGSSGLVYTNKAGISHNVTANTGHVRFTCIAAGEVVNDVLLVAADRLNRLFVCLLSNKPSTKQVVAMKAARPYPAGSVWGQINGIDCPAKQTQTQRCFFVVSFERSNCIQVFTVTAAQNTQANDSPSLHAMPVFMFNGLLSPVLRYHWLLERNVLITDCENHRYVWSLRSGCLERTLLPHSEESANSADAGRGIVHFSNDNLDLGFSTLTFCFNTLNQNGTGVHFGVVKAVFDFLQIDYQIFPEKMWTTRNTIEGGMLQAASLQLARNNTCAVYFPSPTAFSAWKRSGIVTANTTVNLLKVFIAVIESCGDDRAVMEQANNAVFLYTNKLPDIVGSDFAAPSPHELAKFVVSASKLTHVAGRLILNAAIARQSEMEVKRVFRKCNLRSDTRAFTVSMVVPLVSCVLHPEWASPALAKRFANFLVRGMKDPTIDVNAKCLLIENFGKGFSIWRPYLPGTAVCLLELQDLMVCGNVSLRSTALRALLDMGKNSPTLIIDMASVSLELPQGCPIVTVLFFTFCVCLLVLVSAPV